MTTRAQAYLKRARAITLARTYARKAERLLALDLPLDPGYGDLLEVFLDVADTIAAALPDDYFEPFTSNILGESYTYDVADDLVERIEKLAATIDSRRTRMNALRRIAALEAVEGRSPAEAAAFQAKAAELRARL